MFCYGLSLDVFPPTGPLWHAFEIAEIGAQAITPTMLVCLAYDPATSKDVERRFDLATGQPL